MAMLSRRRAAVKSGEHHMIRDRYPCIAPNLILTRTSNCVTINNKLMSRWQSGYAPDCKLGYLGSIPGRDSKLMRPWLMQIGTATGFRSQTFVGSTPTGRTKQVKGDVC